MRSISSALIALIRAYSSTWGGGGGGGGGAGGGVAGATGGGGGGGAGGFGLPQAPTIDMAETIARIRVQCLILPPSFGFDGPLWAVGRCPVPAGPVSFSS